jgi:flavin-dependent dehydrogenase
MNARNQTSAIVIGAGIAGLVTARVLSDHADSVTILERDHLPDGVDTRRGAPQGRHAHVLLAVGQELLDGWFPGLSADLAESGAVPLDASDLIWHQGGAYRARPELGFGAVSMSRPLLETTVRNRLLEDRDNVTIIDNARVDGPILENGRVVGVGVNGDTQRADLVVDCSGRNTRFLDDLALAGFPKPEASAIHIDVAYGSRVVRRRVGDRDGTAAVTIADPTQGHRIGTMVPIEGDRWMVTLGSFHGDVPPSDPARFEAFARSLPSPELADTLSRAKALTPVLTHRLPTSQRRHMERLDRTPDGFLVLGDAICSFNPIYGQGMSSAALQARALGRTVERHGIGSPGLAPAFYRQASKVVDVPWRIAAAADFADPRTTGPKPMGTDLTNRYLEMVVCASHTSATVSLQMMRVQNLLARPESLLTPAMMMRVVLAARRSPAVARRTAPPNGGKRQSTELPPAYPWPTASLNHSGILR